ncbi:hypothetical protein ACFWIA_07170 [Streptomyces sp. NPDC127068]|uniref:hypothetical protein n=1 Tax=Streptomyces sp. NPDC127068 TaxID=3347127 RepID=UPI00364DAD79
MNSTTHPAAEVVVELSDCSKDDAGTVFGVLRSVFDCDRGPQDLPQDAAGGRPSVWSATYDTTRIREAPPATPLDDSVTAEVQGGYLAVDRLRTALAAAFTVAQEGMAAGDQEKEVELLLRSG